MATNSSSGDISQGEDMSWKPSQGLKQADTIVRRLEADAHACGAWLDTNGMFRHRMLEIIGGAIDDAFSEGVQATAFKSEQDAIAAMTRAIEPQAAGLGNGVGFHEGAHPGPGQAGQALGRDGWMDVPATADPVGIDLSDFPADNVVPLERMPEDDLAHSLAMRAAEQGAIEAFGPKKKRGRPKGSKAKKKAKAPKTKADPSPVAESATTETEAPAGEAAS